MHSVRAAATSSAASCAQIVSASRVDAPRYGTGLRRLSEKKYVQLHSKRTFIRLRTLSQSRKDGELQSDDGDDDDGSSAVRKKTAARISRQSLKFSPKTASPFDEELFEEEDDERTTPVIGTRFKGPSLLELEAENDALTRKEEAAKKEGSGETFKITLGQLALVASFTLIAVVMVSTALFVIKVGAVHFNED